jgi:hypothetical protein
MFFFKFCFSYMYQVLVKADSLHTVNNKIYILGFPEMDNETDDANVLSGQVETLSISSSVSSGASSSPLKTRTTNHGSLFQLKLSMLFLIKGITAKYKFHLGTEIADQGGKFDDVLFKYEASPSGQGKWLFRFLQAKHKQNENKNRITSDAILDDNNGDFSISKYFRSYCREIIHGSEGRLPEEIEDVVICTNINFNESNLNAYGIELVPHKNLSDKILNFEKLPSGKIPLRYKLKNTGVVRKILLECSKKSKLHSLAAKLVDCETKKFPLSINDEPIKNCHLALVKEKVIDLKTSRLHSDFIYGRDLSSDASELRSFLRDFTCKRLWKDDWKNCIFKFDEGFGQGEGNQLLSGSNGDKEVNSFLEKLVFSVNTPNEVELDAIMKIELGKYYNLLVSDLQFEMFFNAMLDWFKNKDSRWMTSEEGIRILKDVKNKVDQIRVTILMDYANQINQIAECNDTAAQEMSEKLKPFLESSNNLKINYISTDWSDFTAVKVIAAIKLSSSFKCSDSYMIILSKHAQKKEDLQDLKRIFSEGKSQLLVIVCEDHDPISYDNYTNIVTRSEKKFLLIVKKGTDVRPQLLISEDVISYGQWSEKYKNVILSKNISFQGKYMPVRDLIQPEKAANVLDWSSIKMLLLGKKVVIPCLNTARFEKSLYVKRRMVLPFEFDGPKFWDMKCSKTLLMSQCKINRKGTIIWSTKNEQQKTEIWDKLKTKLRDSGTASVSISEDELIFDKKWKSRTVIISGGAATGKSTVLAHYCEEIKKTKPTHWISRINLVDHCEALSKFEPKTEDDSPTEVSPITIDFLVNELNISDAKNAFARSLLRHQLKMGDNRVIVMFDGFDEISSALQEKVIQLMKDITAKKSAQIFVTTRPHMIDQLQIRLSQLAYSLENFTEQDQIGYLSEYWEMNLKELTIENKSAIIRKFAQHFVGRVTNILKDKEKSFIGIPLQCRLMAECFQSDLQGIIQENRNESEIEKLLDGQKFDLATMYKRLMETKRRAFQEEKINLQAPNQLVGIRY